MTEADRDPAAGGGAPGALTALAAALRNRCPNCGEGRLSRGLLDTLDQCEVCGADFRRHAAGDGAVFFVLTVLCVVAMPTVLALELAYQPPVWAHLLIGFSVTIGLALLLLPPIKRYLVAKSFLLGARGSGPDSPEAEAGGAERRP